MQFDSNVPLFLNEVYDYDIPACHYQILKLNGIDVSDIPEDDKKTRNIKIGIMMRDNPNITKLLRSTTKELIDGYIKDNEIKSEDILLRQYDGLLLRKPIVFLSSQKINLTLKNYYSKFLISISRDSFIADNGSEIIIKGVPNLYPQMYDEISKIIKINFSNKNSIASSLKRMKEQLYTNDIDIFLVPISEIKYKVFLKKMGGFEISDSAIKLGMIEIENIDVDLYFELYFLPFFKSIVMHFF